MNVIVKHRWLPADLEWTHLVGPLWHPKCQRKEEGCLLFQMFHWGLADKLLGSYLISAIWFWTCNDEFSRSLATHLVGISIYFQCAHTRRGHTHWSPAGEMVWHMSLLFSFTWAVKLQCRESFAEILVLLVDKTYFSTVTCVTVVYSFVAVRHLVQCYLLRWSQILFRSTRIFLSRGAQLCSVGFSYSFWVPKVAFYSSSVSRKKKKKKTHHILDIYI